MEIFVFLSFYFLVYFIFVTENFYESVKRYCSFFIERERDEEKARKVSKIFWEFN